MEKETRIRIMKTLMLMTIMLQLSHSTDITVIDTEEQYLTNVLNAETSVRGKFY